MKKPDRTFARAASSMVRGANRCFPSCEPSRIGDAESNEAGLATSVLVSTACYSLPVEAAPRLLCKAYSGTGVLSSFASPESKRPVVVGCSSLL